MRSHGFVRQRPNADTTRKGNSIKRKALGSGQGLPVTDRGRVYLSAVETDVNVVFN
jgi:hypothetical protein